MKFKIEKSAMDFEVPELMEKDFAVAFVITDWGYTMEEKKLGTD